MNSKTRNALLGAAGAVISAVVIREGIYRTMDGKMVGEALDRKEPKAMLRMKEKMKGSADNAEVMAFLEEMEQWMAEKPHEVLRITGQDGTELAGHLFRAENPKRVMVAMHGWRSGWARDFSLVSEFLRKNDCTVLYAEQRGQGDSGGEYMGFGMIERYDCLAWVNWLNENGFRDLPVYLIGISMGATTVLMTAGFAELPDNVAGVIADCGFTSAKDIWKHICEQNLRRPFARREKRVDRLCRKRIDLEPDAYSTLDAMKVCKTPVLFIHGAADSFVPVEMTLENYNACTAPKKLLIVEGANHGMSYVMQREKYEQMVKQFWREQEE